MFSVKYFSSFPHWLLLFLVSFGSIATSAQNFISVCDRSSVVQSKLVSLTGISACEDITAANLSSITTVDINNRGITALYSDDFANLTNLKTLRVQGNSLTELPEGVFAGLSKLETLRIEDNQIASLDEDVFLDLVKLKTLYMQNNQIISFPSEIFQNSPNLKTLRIYGNKMTSLEYGTFANLTLLEYLWIFNNDDLITIEAGLFDDLIKVKELYFYRNSFSEVPAGLFDGMLALETLWMNENDIITFPDGIFANNINLKSLFFHGNAITSLPQGVFSGLTKLTEVRGYLNQLTSLPADTFFGATSLSKVLFSNNPQSLAINTAVNSNDSYISEENQLVFNLSVIQASPFDTTYDLVSDEGYFTLGGTTVNSILIEKGSVYSPDLKFILTDFTTLTPSINVTSDTTFTSSYTGMVIEDSTHSVYPAFEFEVNSQVYSYELGEAISLALPTISNELYTVTYSTTQDLPDGVILTGSMLSGSSSVQGSYEIEWVATSGIHQTNTTFTLIIGDPIPEIIGTIDMNTYLENENHTLVFPNYESVDEDVSFTVTSSTGLLPLGMVVDSTNGSLFGVLGEVFMGNLTFTVTNSYGESDNYTYEFVSIEDTQPIFNGGLVTVIKGIQDYSIQSVILPGTDEGNGNGEITYSLQNLPASLFFNADNLTVHGASSSLFNQTLEYKITDSDGDSITADIQILIEADTSPQLSPIDNLFYYEDLTIANLTLGAAINGNLPYIYSLQALPVGLSFNETSRQLSGTPTENGVFDIPYTVIDANDDTFTQTFSIDVEANIDVIFNEQAQNFSTIQNEKISLSLPQATGNGNITYMVLLSEESLPEGLSFDASNQSIYGTVTQAVTINITFMATDIHLDSANTSFTLTVVPDLQPIIVETISNHQVIQYESLSISIPSASGGNAPLTYEIINATEFIYNQSASTLNGTPVISGALSVIYRVTDIDGDSVEQSFTITIDPDLQPTIDHTISDHQVIQYESLGISIPSASGGNAPLTYEIINATEFIYNQSTSTLNGTPEISGILSVIYRVTDIDGDSIEQSFTITVDPDLQPTIDHTIADQQVVQYESLSVSIPSASGGNTPLAYQILNATEFVYNQSTSTLNGTPVISGALSVIYRVTDIDGDSVEQGFTITVNPDLQPTIDQTIADQQVVQHESLIIPIPSASGGNTPLTYEILNATGFIYNQSSSTLTGTPTVPTVVSVTYRVTDIDSDSIEQSFTITIEPDLHPSIDAPIINQSVIQNELLIVNLPTASGGNGILTYKILNAGNEFVYDPNAGTLSGMPTLLDTLNISYQVTDIDGDVAIENFSIMILTDGIPVLSSMILDQTVTQYENLTVEIPFVIGGNAPLKYEIIGAGNEFLYNQTEGILSGTPSEAAVLFVTYQVTDIDGDVVTDNFSITVEEDLQPKIQSIVADQNVIQYEKLIVNLPIAQGGNGNLTYEIVNASNGFEFNYTQLALAGIPLTFGTLNIVYKVFDEDGDSDQTNFTINIIKDLLPISPNYINWNVIEGLDISQFVNSSLPVSQNGNGKLTYLIEGLPAGLSSNNLTVKGTPEEFGSFLITISTFDQDNDTVQGSFTINIEENTQPTLEFIALNPVIAGFDLVDITLPKAKFGNGELIYQLITSTLSLPSGLSFNASSRTLKGIASMHGNYTFYYTAEDIHGDTANISYVLEVLEDAELSFENDYQNQTLVNQRTITKPLVLPNFIGGNQPYTYELSTPGISGIAIKQPDLTIVGNPTSIPGFYSASYKVTDADGDVVNISFGIEILENTLPLFAEQLSSYLIQEGSLVDISFINATSSDGPLSYSLKGLDDALFTDLSFQQLSNKLQGIASVVGTINTSISAFDIDNDTDTLLVELTVEQAKVPSFYSNIEMQIVNQSSEMITIQAPVNLESGNGPILIRVDGLPEGFIFNHSSLEITGQPEVVGVYNISITLSDSDNVDDSSDQKSLSFNLSVAEHISFVFDLQNLYTFNVHQSLENLTLPDAQGGRGDYTYSLSQIAGELPPGLIFQKTSRVINGTPTETGFALYNYSATDEDSREVWEIFNLTVQLPKPTALAPNNMTILVGDNLSQMLPVPEDANIYTYTYTLKIKGTENSLPPGTRFNTETGNFSGIISQPGIYSLIYTIINQEGEGISYEFIITVENKTFAPVSHNLLWRQALIISNHITSSVRERMSLLGKARAVYQREGNKEAINIIIDSHKVRDTNRKRTSPNNRATLTLSLWSDTHLTSASSSITADNEKLDWDGETLSTQLGFDAAYNDLLFGFISTRSKADLDTTGGDYQLNLDIQSPYIGYRFKSGEIWATIGHGSGNADAEDKGTDYQSSAKYLLTNFGGRYHAIKSRTKFDITFEHTLASLNIQGSESYKASNNKASQSKISLDASRNFKLPNNKGTITPTIMLGIRSDKQISSSTESYKYQGDSGQEIGIKVSYQSSWFGGLLGAKFYKVNKDRNSFQDESIWFNFHVGSGSKSGPKLEISGQQGKEIDRRNELFSEESIYSLEPESSRLNSIVYNQKISYLWSTSRGDITVFSEHKWNDEQWSLGNYELKTENWKELGTTYTGSKNLFKVSFSYNPEQIVSKIVGRIVLP